MGNPLSKKLDETLRYYAGKYGLSSEVLDEIAAASGALTDAATALAAAASAQTAATAAGASAQAAQTTASAAQSLASAAQSVANAAQSAANTLAAAVAAAVAAAQTAQTAASTAQSTASAANDAANVAQGAATAAQGTANTAQSAASTAQTTAAGAQATATSAGTAASSAQSTANTALTTAAAAVPKSAYDANSILIANADDTPVPLAVNVSRLIGRAATGNIRDLTAAEVLAVIGLTPSGSRPLYSPPSTPESIDDEFDSTTMPSGYTWRDLVNGADRTPVSDAVDLYSTLTGTTAAPRISLHTQWRNSWLMWQITDSNVSAYQYTTKQIGTVPTNVIYWTRLRLNWKDSNAGSPSRLQLVVAADNGSGKIDPNNQVTVGLANVGGVARVAMGAYLASASPTAVDDAGLDWNANSEPWEYYGIQKIGGTYYFWAASEAGGSRCFGAGVAMTGFTPAHIGWRSITGSIGTQRPVSVFGVDFLRRMTGSKLPW